MEPTRTSIQGIGPERAERLKAIIMAHVSIEDHGHAEPCWISTRKASKDGSTQTWHDGDLWQTHRLAYLLFTGAIPPRRHIKHKCTLKACCNPAHLVIAGSVAPIRTPSADKMCGTCRAVKPRDEFNINNEVSDGLRADCKDCATARGRARYRAHSPEERARVYAKTRAWERSNQGKVVEARRRSALKSKYGLTPETFAAMLESQGGGCTICGSTSACRSGKAFRVDHCHATGVIRGILCNSCNVSLGAFGDDPAILRRAAEYVESEGKI